MRIRNSNNHPFSIMSFRSFLFSTRQHSQIEHWGYVKCDFGVLWLRQAWQGNRYRKNIYGFPQDRGFLIFGVTIRFLKAVYLNEIYWKTFCNIFLLGGQNKARFIFYFWKDIIVLRTTTEFFSLQTLEQLRSIL